MLLRALPDFDFSLPGYSFVNGVSEASGKLKWFYKPARSLLVFPGRNYYLRCSAVAKIRYSGLSYMAYVPDF